jgi:hypothetical protein
MQQADAESVHEMRNENVYEGTNAYIRAYTYIHK